MASKSKTTTKPAPAAATAAASTTPSSQTPFELPSSHPVSILPTDTARVLTHVHPVLLVSAYVLGFPAVVADPVRALSTALVPLAVVQTAWVVGCLPPAGSTGAKNAGGSVNPAAAGAGAGAGAGGNSLVKKTKGKGKKKDEAGPSILVTTLLALLLAVIAIPCLTILQILFGAPVTTHLPHTLLTSAHIALLAVFPLIYVHGVSGAKWVEVVSATSPFDEVFGGLVGAFVGAWAGAVPIPLDWDREWQKWPVTIVTGAYAGYVLGKTLGGSLLRGKKIEFD